MVPHYFNTVENLDYVGPMPDISYYGVDEMGGGQREEFQAWYATRKSHSFHYKRILEAYCQDDLTVVRLACRVFRREYLQIGYIEVFLESLTFASSCNKVLRRWFLKPDTIGLIPMGVQL